MATFQATTSPTPFGIFDTEKDFIIDANSMVTFVKRKLGDDILSVELTNKQIWMSFEESTLEYGKIVNEYQAKSQLGNLLGNDLGTSADNQTYNADSNSSIDGGPRGQENKFPRETLEFLSRKAEPYASSAGVGGSYNIHSGSITLVNGQQDYDIYETLKMDVDGTETLVKDIAEFQNNRLRVIAGVALHIAAHLPHHFL